MVKAACQEDARGSLSLNALVGFVASSWWKVQSRLAQCTSLMQFSDETHIYSTQYSGTQHSDTPVVYHLWQPQAYFIPDLPLVGKWTRH